MYLYRYGDTGVKAQLQRTEFDEYWNFPATNYSKTFDIPSGGSVAIVFADTTTLAPSLNQCCNENGGISGEVQQSRISNQVENLNRMLKEAKQNSPNWLFVVGHYPIYSAGKHTQCV